METPLINSPPAISDDREHLTARVKEAARQAGFELVGIAPAVSPPGFGPLTRWLEQGFAGEMQYMVRRSEAYSHPNHVLPAVRSIVMLGMNYHTAKTTTAPEPAESSATSGRVASYAQGSTDYHDLLRTRLKQLGDQIHTMQPGCRTRGVVDTAPLLERDFAKLAGLGWFGKNTMLINKKLGSWLFLSALLTDLDLIPDAPHNTSHCGTCTRCLEVCPTDAFPAPYVLDARRCIAYLTIELKGSIPLDLRDGMQDWMFGCDLCQEVCPWNRKAPDSNEPAFQPLPDLKPCDAIEVLQIEEAEFIKRFDHTPLERPGREGLRRNAAIVLGNSGDAAAIPILSEYTQDPSPVVREAVTWAIEKLRSCQKTTGDCPNFTESAR